MFRTGNDIQLGVLSGRAETKVGPHRTVGGPEEGRFFLCTVGAAIDPYIRAFPSVVFMDDRPSYDRSTDATDGQRGPEERSEGACARDHQSRPSVRPSGPDGARSVRLGLSFVPAVRSVVPSIIPRRRVSFRCSLFVSSARPSGRRSRPSFVRSSRAPAFSASLSCGPSFVACAINRCLVVREYLSCM